MNSRSASMILAAACAAASAAAHALPLGENASIELFVGGNGVMPGFFRGQTAPLSSTEPVGQTVYNGLNSKGAYNNRYTAGGEFDYALNSRLTAFGRAAYSQFDGTTRAAGQFFPADNGAAIQTINARFDDATAREFDLGARYSFADGMEVRPFVGAALGVTRLSSTRASFDNLEDGGMTAVELGRASTVFQQRLETGLTFSPLANLDLRLTAAASHLDAGRRSDDPNLALVGLDNARGDVRGHWDYPAELGAVWHF